MLICKKSQIWVFWMVIDEVYSTYTAVLSAVVKYKPTVLICIRIARITFIGTLRFYLIFKVVCLFIYQLILDEFGWRNYPVLRLDSAAPPSSKWRQFHWSHWNQTVIASSDNWFTSSNDRPISSSTAYRKEDGICRWASPGNLHDLICKNFLQRNRKNSLH